MSVSRRRYHLGKVSEGLKGKRLTAWTRVYKERGDKIRAS